MIRERGECGKCQAIDNAALLGWDRRGGRNLLLLASLDTLLNVGGVVAIPWKPLARRHVELKVPQIRKICHFGFL